MADLERRQMPGDIAGIKSWANKGANGVGSVGGLRWTSHGGVVEVRPEDAHRRPQRIRPHLRLSPAYHLGVEPGGLRRIGSPRPLAADQQVAVAFASRAVWRDLQPAVEGALDQFRI